MWTAERIADFTVAYSAAGQTEDVRTKIGDCIVDAIACAACGCGTASAASIGEAAVNAFKDGDTPIWFSDRRTSALAAAYTNAAAVSAYDLDDGNRVALGHPGAAIVPAVLAEAGELGSPGEQVLAAIAVGYQVASAVSASERIRSFATGNWTGQGVVAALGRLRNTPAPAIAQALAITTYQGPHLIDLTKSRFMGAAVKEIIPWSVVNGFMALDLAAAGFAAPLDALDLDNRFQPERAADVLEGPILVEQTYFKRYSSCRFMHATLDGLAAILAEHGIAADDIEEIEVGTFQKGAELTNSAKPETIEAGQYSFPFSLAVVAVHGPQGLAPMSEALLRDRDVERIAGRVRVLVDPEVDAVAPARAPANVAVTAGGRTIRRHVPNAWGDHGSGVGRQDLLDKFLTIASNVASSEQIERISAAVDDITGSGVGPLMDLLGSPHETFREEGHAVAS